jgi:hypothetical protein
MISDAESELRDSLRYTGGATTSGARLDPREDDKDLDLDGALDAGFDLGLSCFFCFPGDVVLGRFACRGAESDDLSSGRFFRFCCAIGCSTVGGGLDWGGVGGGGPGIEGVRSKGGLLHGPWEADLYSVCGTAARLTTRVTMGGGGTLDAPLEGFLDLEKKSRSAVAVRHGDEVVYMMGECGGRGSSAATVMPKWLCHCHQKPCALHRKRCMNTPSQGVSRSSTTRPIFAQRRGDSRLSVPPSVLNRGEHGEVIV